MTETTRDQIEAERDDHAVDQFAKAMKAKLADARRKGRGGWHDPDRCDASFLVDLMIGHLSKGNEGTFLDVANFCMMLHQRGESPEVLQYADRLARIEQQCIPRTGDMPEDGILWMKDQNDGCWFVRSEGYPADLGDSLWVAPDYCPDTPGPVYRHIVDVG